MRTGAPIAQVSLSGCGVRGRPIRCRGPAPPTTRFLPTAPSYGSARRRRASCIFELTVGGTDVWLQHEMRAYPGCCGDETFIGDEDYIGFVDLRYPSDAGDGGLDTAVDRRPQQPMRSFSV